MDEEMTREQLEAEIETVKGEIDEVKAKLDNVREQLGEETVDEKEGEEAGVTPEGELAEEGTAPAEGEEPKPEEGAGEGTEEGAETAEGEGEGSEDQDLKAQEAELMSELISKQMRLVALEKRLNDIVANEAMENYNEEEEM